MVAHRKNEEDKASLYLSARITGPDRARLAAILAETTTAWRATGIPVEASFAQWLRWVIGRWNLGAAPGTPLLPPYGAAPPAPPPADAVRAAFEALSEEERSSILDASVLHGAVLAMPERERGALLEALALTLPVTSDAEILSGTALARPEGERAALLETLALTLSPVTSAAAFLAAYDRADESGNVDARAAALDILRARFPGLMDPRATVAVRVLGALQGDARAAALDAIREALPELRPVEAPANDAAPVEEGERPAARPKKKSEQSLADAVAALPGHGKRIRSDVEARRALVAGWVRDLAARFKVSEDTVRTALDKVRAANRSKGWHKEDIFPESEA